MKRARIALMSGAALLGPITSTPCLGQFCDVERLGSMPLDARFELEIEGPTLFARSLDGVRIVDISDPNAPALISTIDGLDGNDIEIVGTTMYVADFLGRLVIVDVSDPATPVQLSEIATPGPEFLEIEGTTAVVASQFASTVTLFDVSDRSQPAQVSQFRIGDRIESLEVRWPHAFLSNTDDLIILDISDPLNPRELGRYNSGLDGVSFIGLQDSLAFVREARGADRLLQLVNVGRPEAMRLFRTGIFDFREFAPPYEIQGDWLISQARFSNMAIHSLEDRAHPRLLGTFEVASGDNAIKLIGDRLYILGRSTLEIFDIGGCPPYDFCPADLNADGVANFYDTQEFVNLYLAGKLQADFDGDGTLTPADLIAFQTSLAAGCP
ncbi:MAG: GC-type dockerin domain-anchored protein [Phycisphaerales bacterium JB060]